MAVITVVQTVEWFYCVFSWVLRNRQNIDNGKNGYSDGFKNPWEHNSLTFFYLSFEVENKRLLGTEPVH